MTSWRWIDGHLQNASLEVERGGKKTGNKRKDGVCERECTVSLIFYFICSLEYENVVVLNFKMLLWSFQIDYIVSQNSNLKD